jgi:hypothetical protein
MLHADLQHVAALVRAWRRGDDAPLPLPAGVAGENVWDLLAAHRVEAALGPLLPPAARPPGADAQLAAARERTGAMLLECARLWPSLQREARRPVLLKGAALAQTVYPQPWQRWFVDLDVLVERDEVDQVCAALADKGYRPRAPERDALYDRHHFHRILTGRQGLCVEVHWALTLPGSAYALDAVGVAARSVEIAAGDLAVAVPTPVDHVLHAVYQNIADGYRDLRRVLDLTLLLRRLDEGAWAELRDRAAAGGLDRALGITLHVVKSIVGQGPGLEGLDDALSGLGATGRRLAAGLDPAGACLQRRGARDRAYTHLLHLLATPPGAARRRELLRTIPFQRDPLVPAADHAAKPRPVALAGRAVEHARFLGRLTWLAGRALLRG